jgi:hypothetical protein
MAFTRAAVEHHTYNTNAEFANFRPCRRATPTADLNVEAGVGFAIRDCIFDLCMPRRYSRPCYRGRRDHHCDSPGR